MSVKRRHQPAPDPGRQPGVRDNLREESGILKTKGMTRSRWEKDIL